MPVLLLIRPRSGEEVRDLRNLAESQKMGARLRDLTRTWLLSHQRMRAREIVALVGIGDATVRSSSSSGLSHRKKARMSRLCARLSESVRVVDPR